MRQIKKERLRPMNCFTKATDEFVRHNFLIKSWLKTNTPSYPGDKNRKRGNPRPPALPGTTGICFRRAQRSRPTTAHLEQSNARQYKGVNDRTFDQHRRGEQNKDVNSIAQFPFVSLSEPLPNEQADQKNHERQRHVGTHERGQPWAQQIQSKRAERNHRGDFSVRVLCSVE